MGTKSDSGLDDVFVEVIVRMRTGDGTVLLDHETDFQVRKLLGVGTLEDAERRLACLIDSQVVQPVRAVVRGEVERRLEALPYLRLDRPLPSADWPAAPGEDDQFADLVEMRHRLERLEDL